MKKTILNSQKEEIFNIITSYSLEPSDFLWTVGASNEGGKDYISILSYKKSDYYFKFDIVRNAHFCEYSPGENKYVEQGYPGNWEGQIDYFTKWILYLSREINSVDLWDFIESTNSLNKTIDNDLSNNTPFLPQEIERINQNLEEVRNFLQSNYKINETQLGILNSRILYLKEASGRVGKKDYVLLLFGMIINIVLMLAMPPESSREFYKFINLIFKWLGEIKLLQ